MQKIRRAKTAIAKWPCTGDLKSWIVNHAAVTRRWVTEAARRGDIHVPGEKRKATPRRRHRAHSPHIANFELFQTPIKQLGYAPDDEGKNEPHWIHDGKDERGLFKTRKRADGGTYREYRHFCKKCGVEVSTLPVCPECQAEQPRR